MWRKNTCQTLVVKPSGLQPRWETLGRLRSFTKLPLVTSATSKTVWRCPRALMPPAPAGSRVRTPPSPSYSRRPRPALRRGVISRKAELPALSRPRGQLLEARKAAASSSDQGASDAAVGASPGGTSPYPERVHREVAEGQQLQAQLLGAAGGGAVLALQLGGIAGAVGEDRESRAPGWAAPFPRSAASHRASRRGRSGRSPREDVPPTPH